MMKIGRKARYGLAAATITAIPSLFLASPASATHSWGNYHWFRASNPFTLDLGKTVSAAWNFTEGGYVEDAAVDWSLSSVLDTGVAAPGVSDPKKCWPTSGKVQVCSYKYGPRGWLGLAQIWISGGHITQGVVKLNDSYFALGSTYNTPAWRSFLACQEIGHTFGLDHQNEDFYNPNLGTCMDYTNDPDSTPGPSNQHPDDHDYAMLQTIYTSHTDRTVATATVASAAPADDWGKAVRFTRSGKGRVFVKDLGPNRQVVTFVTWAPL